MEYCFDGYAFERGTETINIQIEDSGVKRAKFHSSEVLCVISTVKKQRT